MIINNFMYLSKFGSNTLQIKTLERRNMELVFDYIPQR
jgi:hypothetical protein